MSLTTSAAWKARQYDRTARRHIIIKLTDGSSTWLISDIDMDLTDGHVFSGLSGFNGIESGVDIYSRKFKMSDVTFKLSNLPVRYDATTGTDIRLGDELGALRGTIVEIYFKLGDDMGSLSECLKRWIGKVVEAPSYSEDIINVKAVSIGKFIDRKLPQTLVSEVFPTTPIENITKRIPIVYGEFTQSGDNLETFDRSGLGLAIGVTYREPVVVTGGEVLKGARWVLATHSVFSITRLFQDVGTVDPAIHQEVTKNINDSGYATALQIALEDEAVSDTLFVYHPVGSLSGIGYTWDGDKLAQDPENAFDKDDLTRAGIYNNFTTTSGHQMFGLIDVGLPSSTPGVIGIVELKPQCIAGEPSGVSLPVNYIAIYYDSDGSTFDTRLTELVLSSTESWEQAASFESLSSSLILAELTLGVRSVIQTGLPIDSAIAGHVYDCRMVQRLLSGWYDKPFAEMKGRTFGSWIDDVGRVNDYNAGDLIEDPVYIIESILRDELGMTDVEINRDSFDDAADSNLIARFNIHDGNSMKAFTAIRALSEQGRFAFLWAGDGSAKILDLSDKTPTTTRIIPHSHLRRGKISVGKMRTIRNKMTVNSRYQEEYGNTADQDLYEDSTSQNDHGEYVYTATWENIAGTSAALVAAFHVNSTDGIWSKEHSFIKLELSGFIHADMLEGDWIELEAESFDPHIKLYGESWSGKQFLLTSTRQTEDSTHILAIELWT